MRGLGPLGLVTGSRVLRHTVEGVVAVARLGDDLVHGVSHHRHPLILRLLHPTLGAPDFPIKLVNFPDFPVNIIEFRVSGVNTVVSRSRGLDLTEGVGGNGERAGEFVEETILSSLDCCRLLLLLFPAESFDS